MTSPTNRGWQSEPDQSGQPTPADGQPLQWSPPPPPQPVTQQFSTPPAAWNQPSAPYPAAGDQPPAQSGAQWAAQQSPANAQQPPAFQQPYAGGSGAQWAGQPYAGDSGAQWAGQPGGPTLGGPPGKKSNKKLYAILAAVVVAALVGGGLFFFLSGDDITYQGREIVEPEKVLTDSEARLDAIVDERNGAANEATACYFVARNADTTDIENRLVCGPVLFVDGDEGQPYLTFPLEASTGEGDATLTVAQDPESPDPAALADPELLRRPDGGSPPDGSGGLAAPEPPRAEEAIFTTIPSEGVDLEATPATARIGSPTMSIDLTGIGEVDRYGQGDDARRPAEGEKFVAFEITGAPGEIGPVGDFSIAVAVGDEPPITLPDTADTSDGGTATLAISVPEDTEDLSLVVTDGTLEQRLSLTSGEPDPGNIAVWQRTNRGQALAVSQPVTVRASKPGFVSEDFPCTVVVDQVTLVYFAGPNNDRAPSGPSQSFLDLNNVLNCEGSPGQFDPVFWSLTLPDGTVLPALDLNDNPDLIQIYFEVPADFTEGTLTFGGIGPAPDDVTYDTLGVFVPIPLSIPAE